MKNKVTIVSALFDIGRDQWQHYAMSYNTYLNWYRNTLSIDANHVVFTDAKFYDQVRDLIHEVGHPETTILLKRQLGCLEASLRYGESLEKVMGSESFKKLVSFNVPECLYPAYNLVMFNKVFFLKEVADANPFNSEWFIWADCGGLRENLGNYKDREWPSSKIDTLPTDKVHFFSHHTDIRVDDPMRHSLSQMRYIQGTAFFVPKAAIDPFVEVVDETIEGCLLDGYIGSDEKVFDLCYLKKPELFDLEKSTWRQYYSLYQ